MSVHVHILWFPNVVCVWLWVSVFLWLVECLGCLSNPCQLRSEVAQPPRHTCYHICLQPVCCFLVCCVSSPPALFCSSAWKQMSFSSLLLLAYAEYWYSTATGHRFKLKLTADITFLNQMNDFETPQLMRLTNKTWWFGVQSVKSESEVAANSVLFTNIWVLRCDGLPVTASSPSPPPPRWEQ